MELCKDCINYYPDSEFYQNHGMCEQALFIGCIKEEESI